MDTGKVIEALATLETAAREAGVPEREMVMSLPDRLLVNLKAELLDSGRMVRVLHAPDRLNPRNRGITRPGVSAFGWIILDSE